MRKFEVHRAREIVEMLIVEANSEKEAIEKALGFEELECVEEIHSDIPDNTDRWSPIFGKPDVTVYREIPEDEQF